MLISLAYGDNLSRRIRDNYARNPRSGVVAISVLSFAAHSLGVASILSPFKGPLVKLAGCVYILLML